MKRSCISILLLCLSLGFPWGSLLADASLPRPVRTQDRIQIQLQGDILSLQAEQATLREVIQAVARAAGFETHYLGELSDNRVPWHLDPVPLRQGLAKLLGDHSMTVLCDEVNGHQTIVKLYIIAGLRQASAPAVRSDALIVAPNHNLALQDQGDSWRRLAEVERMAGLRDDAARTRLQAALSHDAEPLVRRRAVALLADMEGQTVLEALLVGLGDDDADIRITVVHSLGRIGSDAAILGIGQVIMGDADPNVRRAAVSALADHQGGMADAFLVAARKDRADSVREIAARVLQQMSASGSTQ